MTPHLLSAVMLRDLDGLRAEIEAYPDDGSLWRPVPGLVVLGGTLVLHLVGNMQHFVGAVLGASGYVRDREAEFARRGVPRAELLAQVAAARAVVERTLAGLEPARLAETYPQPVGGLHLQTGEFLVHLVSHLGYHLGQLDSHRRLSTGNPRPAGAESLAALPSARPVSG
jgi:DinB superfamily